VHRTVNRAAPDLRKPGGQSWEFAYGLPALGAVIGLVGLPVLAVLWPLGLLSSGVAGTLYFAVPLTAIALCWAKLGVGVKSGAERSRYPVVQTMIALFAAGAVACLVAQFTLRSDDPGAMWLQFLMSMSLMCFVPVYWALGESRAMLKPVLLGWSLVAAIAIITMLLHITGILRGEQFGERQFGIIGDPVAWIISLFVVVYFDQRKWPLFALCVFLLVLTGSRGPFVMTALGLIISVMSRPSRSTSEAVVRIVGACVTLLGFMLVPLFAPYLVSRLAGTDIAQNDRMPTILFSIERYLESPIFGGGFGAQVFYMQKLGLRHGQDGLFIQQPATWLQMLTDFGVAGFLAFAVFSGLLLWSCVRVVRSVPTGVAPGTPMAYYRTVRAMACWLIPFILLNHSAAYVVPGSLMGLMYFAGGGAVIGLDQRFRKVQAQSTNTGRLRAGGAA
jgi:hypothetical protein